MKFKDQKGAITLFVLVSLLLFIATITTVFTFMQGKNGAVNQEVKQIKSKYEVSDEELYKIYNANINFRPTFNLTKNDNTITGTIKLNTNNINVRTLKYGLLKSDRELSNTELSSNKITDWTFFENQTGEFNVYIFEEDLQSGYYYICLMVNNMEFWKGIDIENNILYAIDGEFSPEDSNWKVNTIQGAIDYLYQLYSN